MFETLNRSSKRNFLINLSEGALFIAGTSFISTQTVLPALVNRLGGGNLAIGALAVITWVGLFLPQIFAARYAQTQRWKKTWAIRTGLVQRFVVLVTGIVILSFGNSHKLLTLSLFLILFGFYQILTGIATPFWFDMYAKLTPVGLRGRLSGLRTSLAGGGAFIGAFILTWLLVNFEFPLGYALAFFITFGLQFISIFLQFAIIEEHPSNVLPSQSHTNYFKQLRNVFLENIPFRNYIFVSIFLILATMPLSFFTVYGLRSFNTDESFVGQFTLIMVIGQGIGALIIGFVADRYGNKLALISASGTMLIASIFALLSPTIEWFRMVFLFMGINLGSELMTRHNLALEYSPIEQRSTYIGLMNTILAPLYLSGLLGGWMSDMFGYQAVFSLGIIFSITGMIFLILLVHEPRSYRSENRDRNDSSNKSFQN